VVGFTTGSREDVTREDVTTKIKPVIREQHDDDDYDNVIIIIIIIIIITT
jgi:hypothetical protein